MKTNLTQLGGRSHLSDEQIAEPQSILEAFPNPKPDRDYEIKFVFPEFTSLCPMTGQPDFATIVIDYRPHRRCVESKSLKLYLGGYRMFGEFHESCISRIANDLITLLDPAYIKVEGRFTPRGGIPFWPTAEYTRPADKPELV